MLRYPRSRRTNLELLLGQNSQKTNQPKNENKPDTNYGKQHSVLRSVFTDVHEGNRLRRALIGFGSGQTDLQVVTGIDDLSQGPPKPLYEIDTHADSGKTLGAAPTIVLGPYGAAARYVLAGKDLDNNVKQTALKITAEIARRVQEAK